jgi:UDP-GlcNAc:undecaprenyl-phosphate GlcNAc-1-phosphate transferase
MLAFVLAVVCCENADRLGKFLGVMDRPDGGRKQHDRETPLVGGLALVLPLLVLELCWLLYFQSHTRLFSSLFIATLGFWLLGFVDDRCNLRPIYRLATSFALFGVILVIEPKMLLTRLDFAPLLPPIELGAFAVPFTLLCLVGLVNAINMADGKNGVVLGLAICWAYGLSEYTHENIRPYLYLLLVCLITISTYNWSGRLFLGDSGSYVVGALIGLQTIYFYHDPKTEFPMPTAAVWLLIPVLDCLRLMVVRVSKGRSPFSADARHLHHYLAKRISWNLALPIYLGLSAGPGFLALLWPQQSLQLMLLSVVLYFGVLAWARQAPLIVRAAESVRPE